MRESNRPTVTIRTTGGNVSDLRARVVRERLKSDGCGGAVLVREVCKACDDGALLVATTMEEGER
jgi:hypothetical protein